MPAPERVFRRAAVRLRALIFALAVTPATALACVPYGEGALWGEADSRVVGADLAYQTCAGRFGSLRMGLSYYADDKFIYKGVTGAARFSFGSTVAPFVGAGLLAGTAERDVDASQDGVDNNGNGYIDEPYEKDTEYEASGFLYPEAGVSVQVGGAGFTVSARRYYGAEFSGDLIYSVGIHVPLGAP